MRLERVLRRLLPALMLAAGAVVVSAQEPVPLVRIEPEPGWKAWWLRAELRPEGQRLRGLHVPRLHPRWCAADEFSADRLPPGALIGPGGIDLLAAERASFSLQGRFDGGPRELIASTGAYRRCDGEIGLFLLILDPTSRGLKLRYLLERPFDGSAVAVLRQVDERTLRWTPCLACNEGVLLRWNPVSRHFEPRPLKSDDEAQD